jgi:enoyl-CoA hydratase/carnithine racemase
METVSTLLLTQIDDGVAVVTLNNPPLNLVTLNLSRLLYETVQALAANPAVRVMVLTGSGNKAFCVGSDLKEFPEMMAAGAVVPKKLKMENDAFSAIRDFTKPTIAALNGLAYGGGLEMALCCDMLVAEQGGRIALPEIKLGVFPGSGGTVRMTRRIGESRAKKMMFTGEPVTVEDAHQWGLINDIVPKGHALEHAKALARTIAEQPNIALQLCKASANMSFDMDEKSAVYASLPLSEKAFTSQDCKEGVRAFFAKEKPRFSHS